MKCLAHLLALGIVFAIPSSSSAQMNTEGNPGSSSLLKIKNTGGQALDGIGIHSESKPVAYYGIGVLADGGFIGVKGVSTVAGSGYRYGGYFDASGASTANYGIYSQGNGGSFSYAGYFSGNVHVTGTLTNPSDPRLKTGIRPLTNVVAKLSSLQASTFQFDSTRIKVRGLPSRKQIGLMADEVAAVFPELVHEIPVGPQQNGRPADGEEEATYRSVNYVGLVPVLVAAIKEQQAQIQALQDEVAILKGK